MKIKRSLAAFFFAAACFRFAAVCQEISFENELSSDVVSIRNGASYDEEKGRTDFAGIKENAVVLFTSEKLDAGIDVAFILDDWSERNFGLKWDDIDWFIEFRPVDIISLGFHEDIYSDGSYLPIYDDNIGTGNFGSDGFTVAFRPAEGLSLFATVPFGEEDDTVNFFSGDDTADFQCGFGINYAYEDLFSAGCSVQNAADSGRRSFGIFVQASPLEGLSFGAGYSFSKEKNAGFDDLSISEEFGVCGESVLNLFAGYEVGPFACAAEGLVSLDDEDSEYDAYLAVSAGFAFSELISADIAGAFLFDNSSDGAKPVVGINPNILCTLGNHAFGAGVNFETTDGDTFVSFPLTYTYSF